MAGTLALERVGVSGLLNRVGIVLLTAFIALFSTAKRNVTLYYYYNNSILTAPAQETSLDARAAARSRARTMTTASGSDILDLVEGRAVFYSPGDTSMPLRKLLVSASTVPARGLAGLAPGASTQPMLTSKFGVLGTAGFPGTIGMKRIKVVQDTP